MAASVREIEAELAELRAEAARDDIPELRTSVMTHIAWVPREWEEAAQEVMAGLEERHPSRAILLFPEPDARTDELAAEPSLQCFPVPGQHREVCAEVIPIRLRGRKALAPASVVLPLLIADLPVFLRWRGEPQWDSAELEQLVGVADRLVVDSGEWRDADAGFARLAELFDRIAVSDIAWARTERWRSALARTWPEIAGVRRLHVRGPRADALLLAAWLRSRLDREIELDHDDGDAVEAVAYDDIPVATPRAECPSPSDLLSEQLDVFGRDRIYEAAVLRASS